MCMTGMCKSVCQAQVWVPKTQKCVLFFLFFSVKSMSINTWKKYLLKNKYNFHFHNANLKDQDLDHQHWHKSVIPDGHYYSWNKIKI